MQGRTQTTLPQFVEIGTKKIENLNGIFKNHNVACKEVLLLCDDTTLRIGGHDIELILQKQNIGVSNHLVQNSDDGTIVSVREVIRRNAPDLVIGFGGGKVLDVAKLTAAKNNTRFISIPTTVSNDGLASPVSVIKDSNNIPISHITRPPYGVIVDIDVVRQAPARHLKAGVGDLLSNLSAVFDVRLGHERKSEKIDTNALDLAEVGARRLLESQQYDMSSAAFLQNLTQGLIKSGFAMCIFGTSRPASGSEHKISHSIDHHFPPSRGLHGEQVGIAALFTMVLQKNWYLEAVKKFYEKIGFPCKLSYLNLSRDDFTEAVLNATKIRPERYTILEDITPIDEDIRRALKKVNL
ncbi:iron-containing alcohol dehydrogenase [candidate division WOR-3 bacterium]|nr:iron-containing alcohol dehydrogenase [candidate division WOR-3 bacterium]